MNWLNSIFQKLLKFLVFPVVIANLIKSLTMGEDGFSLKKVLAVYATIEAAIMSHEMIRKPDFNTKNGIWLLVAWLVYAGILVGIYSIKDIGTAIKDAKGNEKEQAPAT